MFTVEFDFSQVVRALENAREYAEQTAPADAASIAKEDIVTRTARGVDPDGRKYQPYTKRYKKLRERFGFQTSRVDLRRSGEMIDNLNYDEQTTSLVPSAQAEGRAKGHQYGYAKNNLPARPWLGITHTAALKTWRILMRNFRNAFTVCALFVAVSATAQPHVSAMIAPLDSGYSIAATYDFGAVTVGIEPFIKFSEEPLHSLRYTQFVYRYNSGAAYGANVLGGWGSSQIRGLVALGVYCQPRGMNYKGVEQPTETEYSFNYGALVQYAVCCLRFTAGYEHKRGFVVGAGI